MAEVSISFTPPVPLLNMNQRLHWTTQRARAREWRAKAKAICAACLVRGQCLSANYSQRDGIYGGLTAGERRERRRLELGTAS